MTTIKSFVKESKYVVETKYVPRQETTIHLSDRP